MNFFCPGRIPYTFGSGITGYKKDVIQQAMEHWSSQTCLKFEKKTAADEDYVQFFSGGGCYSDLGKWCDPCSLREVLSKGPCNKIDILFLVIAESNLQLYILIRRVRRETANIYRTPMCQTRSDCARDWSRNRILPRAITARQR